MHSGGGGFAWGKGKQSKSCYGFGGMNMDCCAKSGEKSLFFWNILEWRD